MTRTISPTSDEIQHAAEVIRAEVGCVPTETVYGLGANALDPVAVDRIFAAKGRPAPAR
jgi:L-threonylcarbamoyladenylate synthase